MGVNIEELVDIAFDALQRMGAYLDVSDIYDVLKYTVRKAEVNGKGAEYVPILLENELRDFVTRKAINRIGRLNLCAQSA